MPAGFGWMRPEATQRQLCLTERELRANAVPTLSIIGANDPYRPDVVRMEGVMGNHRVHVVPGADHGSCRRDPSFVAALEAFLGEHGGR